jgi:intracellular sulfur oxidation DsrE/DsrF family protein
MMNLLNVEKQEIPAFIEIVPYGPAEVDRLEQQGFIKL